MANCGQRKRRNQRRRAMADQLTVAASSKYPKALAPRRAWRRTARTRASETARGTRTPLPTRKVSLLCTTYIQSARTTTGVATDGADSSERDSERHAHTTTNKKGISTVHYIHTKRSHHDGRGDGRRGLERARQREARAHHYQQERYLYCALHTYKALAPRRAWRRTARTRASETARGTRTPLPTRKVSLLCTTYIQSARTTTGVATDGADSSERDSERHAHTTTNKKGISTVHYIHTKRSHHDGRGDGRRGLERARQREARAHHYQQERYLYCALHTYKALAPRRAWRRTSRTRASETARGTRTPLPTRKVSLLCTTYIQSARTTTGVATDVADSSERDSERHAHTTTNKKGISTRSETPPEETDAIDPDEPRYCLCDQISFGEMILCDNDLCPIEWFHFSCVSLTTKPKGKWFCPKCRGDRPNIMKPKGQFLKELE
ncbi:Inhibitor of growth protein, partial [Operophtera brumata]